MNILQPTIIAPDSSHWAKWLDGIRSRDPDRRARASDLHARLIERGRIPLLSWHHLEELLGVEDDATAQARIATLERLPLLAWLRLPHEEIGLGSVVQVFAAEAIAAAEGHRDLIAIRDRARDLMLQMGEGTEAIGEESWIWDMVRPVLHGRKGHSDMVAALGPLRSFDESKTIGELSTLRMNSPEEMRVQFARTHERAYQEALQATDGDAAAASSMADDFIERVLAIAPPPGTTVRELLITALVGQGLDEHEIRDECLLADLSRLGSFRSQLRTVASETGRSFVELKQVPMDLLPSRVIDEALRTHGQPREKRPGSDVNDAHLAVLAAYCDVLYVDKRTAEDFRRACQKEKRLDGLIGEIAKAADFEALLGLATG